MNQINLPDPPKSGIRIFIEADHYQREPIILGKIQRWIERKKTQIQFIRLKQMANSTDRKLRRRAREVRHVRS